jgi:hypothetical protein
MDREKKPNKHVNAVMRIVIIFNESFLYGMCHK